MSTSDTIGLVASYLYAGCLIGAGELLQRLLGWPSVHTRKIIHVGAGMWVFGILALFDDWRIGVIPFATFIALNYLFYRLRLFRAMDTEASTPGTVYFAISITVLFVLLWRPDGPVDRVHVAVAGVMVLTWGDALAALVGERFGRHRYKVVGGYRSLEGSAAMFASSVVVMLLTLLLLPGSELAPLAPLPGAPRALLAALLAAAVAAGVEAVSPHGTDNLAVPIVGAAVVGLLL